MTIQREQPTFATREPVDFVVVGSGAAGGVVARELYAGVERPGRRRPRRDRVYGDRRPLILNLGLTAPKEVLLVMPVRLRKGNWKMGNGWGPGFSHPNFHLRIPIS